ANNLPQNLTSFIGREREIKQIRRLLDAVPCVTLTGAGGVGKTRLALQTAAELLEQFSDGIFLVELGALRDERLVPQETGTALGLREEPGRALTETLIEHLRNKRLLLVLDNCEHLTDACAALTEALLNVCPHLKMLATSRARLGLGRETVHRV